MFVHLTSVGWSVLCVLFFCRGRGTSGTRATTGRSRPPRSSCSPASAPAPLGRYTKGNGTVRLIFMWEMFLVYFIESLSSVRLSKGFMGLPL